MASVGCVEHGRLVWGVCEGVEHGRLVWGV